MAEPSPGFFVLRDAVKPALTAGVYTLTAAQELSTSAGSLSSGDPIPTSTTTVEITAPRFTLPPAEILSTFPPNQAVGAFSSRLPQIVIRRRTLPWERAMPGAPHLDTPWLALVVVTAEEADLLPSVPVAESVTPGVTLTGRKDADTTAALVVRESIVGKVFPAKDELHLLTHVRQVDLSDTELAIGDDDGWMAVIVANRLPQPGVRYRVCLLSLEGQLSALADSRDIPIERTFPLVYDAELMAIDRGLAAFDGPIRAGPAPENPYAPFDAWSGGRSPAGKSTRPMPGARFARSVGRGAPRRLKLAPPERQYTFPVLAQWTFTCADGGDFQSRMQGLHVGLSGTVATAPATPGRPAPPRTRPLPEVLASGHIGLDARTRDGDADRVWYRGPLLPSAGTRTAVGADGVLPLRHVSEHGRRLGPDGREQIGLAVAFEIGRLLALAEPSVVAALQRWRRAAFEIERRQLILGHDSALARLLEERVVLLGHTAGERLLGHLGANDASLLGPVRALIDPLDDPLFVVPRFAAQSILVDMGLSSYTRTTDGAFAADSWDVDTLSADGGLSGLTLAVERTTAELVDLALALNAMEAHR